MDRVVGVELWESVGDLGKEPLAGALEAAGAVQVWNLSPAEPLRKQVRKELVGLPDAATFGTSQDSLKEWPYAPAREFGQLELFVLSFLAFGHRWPWGVPA